MTNPSLPVARDRRSELFSGGVPGTPEFDFYGRGMDLKSYREYIPFAFVGCWEKSRNWLAWFTAYAIREFPEGH